MNIKQSKTFIPLISLFLISVFFISSTHLAGAAGISIVKWKINLILSEKTPTTELTVQKWTKLRGGQQELDDEKVIQLSCQGVGNPEFTNSEVVFDGSSYVVCDVPSIQAVALNTWNLAIAPSCQAKEPYIMGEATLEGNPADSTPENPVFYRDDDIQFNMPLDVNTQESNLDASFGNIESESDTFVINTIGHDYSATFDKVGANFSPIFVVDGISLSATPAVISSPALLSNLESTIYFGYSPVTGEYFEGTLGETEVDPVCPTTG